jgi:hypothetical protein
LEENDYSEDPAPISEEEMAALQQKNLEFSKSGFLKNITLERPLNEKELKILELLEISARRHGFDKLISYLNGIPEEVLRRHAQLRQEIKATAGLTDKDFFDFLRFLQYCKHIALHKPVHKDQINDFLIAGNTIAVHVTNLFNAGQILAENGVRLNGVFGKQGTIKRESELSTVDDLMPFLYILNHTLHKENPLPTYFLFFGETPNPVTGILSQNRVLLEENSGPWFNANIVLARAAKFLKEATDMSLDVTELGVIVVDHHDQAHIIPVICALYDLHNMTMWRVVREHHMIFAERLEQWFAKNIDTSVYPDLPLFRRKDVIRKHIERLTLHSGHGSEHLELRLSYYKKIGCVDGRQDNHESELGSLIGEKDLAILCSDNHTSHISIAFHTECGYLNTAITLHKLFRALKNGIDPQDRVTMSRALLFINMLMTKPWLKREKKLFKEFMQHVDLSKSAATEEEQKDLYKLLFNLITDNQGTLRYATTHMSDRGVFEMHKGFPVMTAAKNVEKALADHGLELSVPFKNLLISEELARLDCKRKRQWVAEHADDIIETRLDRTVPTIQWFIEDFVTGRYYKYPVKFIEEQTREEILSNVREDKKTGKKYTLYVSPYVNTPPCQHGQGKECS